MKKTRGKRKINSSKRKKSYNKFLIPLLIAAFFAFAVLLDFTNTTGNAIGEGGSFGRGGASGSFGNGTAAPASGGGSFGNSGIAEGSWPETWRFLGEGMFAKVFLYIFGVPISSEAINSASAGIITISVWLLLFITFSDIIASFTSFSKLVAWGIGFLLAVIAANLGFIVKTVTVLTGAFAFIGTLSIFAGLVMGFAAFLAVNIGVGKFADWALRRRATISAHQAAAGGKKLSGVIEGIGEIGEGLTKVGKKR